MGVVVALLSHMFAILNGLNYNPHGYPRLPTVNVQSEYVGGGASAHKSNRNTIVLEGENKEHL